MKVGALVHCSCHCGSCRAGESRRQSARTVAQIGVRTCRRGTGFLARVAGWKELVTRARIGHPYADGDNTWACPCEIAGFERRYPDIRGAGSWQSLCLAIGLVRSRLEDWQSKGGAILDTETREPMQLAPVFGSVAY